MNSYSAAYWQIVRDCMVELFRVSEPETLLRIRDFRLRLQQAPTDFLPEMVYHEEPLRLAAQLAGREEPEGGEASERYHDIMRRRNAEAAALGSEEEVQRARGIASAA